MKKYTALLLLLGGALQALPLLPRMEDPNYNPSTQMYCLKVTDTLIDPKTGKSFTVTTDKWVPYDEAFPPKTEKEEDHTFFYWFWNWFK